MLKEKQLIPLFEIRSYFIKFHFICNKTYLMLFIVTSFD